MLFYAFYNSPLISVPRLGSCNKLALGFVDNVMFLAVVKFLMEAHAIICNLIEHADGMLNWFQQYNSSFKPTKLTAMN